MATPTLSVTIIQPKKLNVKQFRTKILAAMESEAQIQNKILLTSTATWKHEKPTFKSEVIEKKEIVLARTGLSGSKKGVQKWLWLSGGTKKRWAVMSGNWKSKTKPSRYRSGSGRGHVVIVGKRNMKRAQPGIKPRKWPIKTQNRRKNLFPKKIKTIMVKAGGNAF